jgi:hypothetical protein
LTFPKDVLWFQKKNGNWQLANLKNQEALSGEAPAKFLCVSPRP